MTIEEFNKTTCKELGLDYKLVNKIEYNSFEYYGYKYAEGEEFYNNYVMKITMDNGTYRYLFAGARLRDRLLSTMCCASKENYTDTVYDMHEYEIKDDYFIKTTSSLLEDNSQYLQETIEQFRSDFGIVFSIDKLYSKVTQDDIDRVEEVLKTMKDLMENNK